MNVRTRTAAVAVALAAAAGTTVATAGPAAAASAVTFCFSFANPPTHSLYANRPVYLYQQLPHGWELYRSGYTGSNGCGTFYNTPQSAPVAVRAYTSTAYQTWDGWSAVAPAGSRTYYLGHNSVFRTR